MRGYCRRDLLSISNLTIFDNSNWRNLLEIGKHKIFFHHGYSRHPDFTRITANINYFKSG